MTGSISAATSWPMMQRMVSLELAGAVGAKRFVSVVRVREADVWVRHGVAGHDALDLGGFGGLRAQQLEPGGLIAEQVLGRNAGADGGTGWQWLVFWLALPNAVSRGGLGRARHTGQDGIGGD